MPVLTKKTRILLTILCVMGAVGLGFGGWQLWKQWLRPKLYPPSALVRTPEVVLRELKANVLYYSPEAHDFLEKQRPDLLAADDQKAGSERAQSYAQGTVNPKLFRQLDRQYRFDKLLLLGNASNWQRLVEHLLEPEPAQRDFRLVYMDHWALVFERGAAKEWDDADAETLRAKMSGLHRWDRATFLAKTALNMLATRKYELAKRWLDEALDADSDSADALSGLAQYYVWKGDFKKANNFADQTLAQDPQNAQAVSVKVSALRALKYTADAFKWSVRLNTMLAEDPVRLFQHAQLAHDAKEYSVEIASLTRLVFLARQAGMSVGKYEAYLGQAHAFAAMEDTTHAPRAVEHLKKALADPTLPAKDRQEAKERLATIAERTGLR